MSLLKLWAIESKIQTALNRAKITEEVSKRACAILDELSELSIKGTLREREILHDEKLPTVLSRLAKLV